LKTAHCLPPPEGAAYVEECAGGDGVTEEHKAAAAEASANRQAVETRGRGAAAPGHPMHLVPSQRGCALFGGV